MKKINIPLIVGLIIVLGVMFLIFFGEYYAPHDPSVGEQSLWVENSDGSRTLKRAPFPPDKKHLFGTDNGGRDVLSSIMAGAKNTFIIVFLATLLRFLIAIPIAYFAAFGEKISKRFIVIFSSTFSAVPSLLICIMILKIKTIKELELWPSMIAFITVFTIVGWGRLASNIEEKIKDILKQDFIQGEVAIGKSKFAIAMKNVSAHIMPTIIIFVFLEIAFVLLLLAQLGIFEVFVGNKQVFTVKVLGTATRTNFNYFPEWGAMLASTKQSIIGNRFWLSLFPLLAFSISIIGFNLLGEGLNYELSKRNSRFISYVNKFWFHLSPKTFIDEIKDYRNHRKILAVKSLVIIAIGVLVIIPKLNVLTVEEKVVMAHVMEFEKDEYEGRLIGTTGHDRSLEYIVNRLKDYNIDPLFNGNYVSEFHIDSTINIINDSKLIVTNDSNEKLDELKYKIDYYFESWSSGTIDSIEGEILNLEEYISGDFDPSKKYFLIVGPEDNQSYIYDNVVDKREEQSYIKGVILTDPKKTSFFSKRIDLDEKGLIQVLDNVEAFSNSIPPIKIRVGRRAARQLLNLAGNKITISANIDSPNGLIGKNIGGVIEGRNSDNPIIMATTYDYLGFHDTGTTVDVNEITKYKGLYENGTSIGGTLEIARNLGSIKQIPERTIIFLFIDGSKVTIEGITDINNFGILDNQPLFVSLRYMGINKWNKPEDSLYHYTIVNNYDSKMEQEFHQWLRRNSAKSDYYIVGDSDIRENSLLSLKDKDIVAIVLQGIKERDKDWHIGQQQSDIKEIDVKRLKTHIQYLLDSISDMAYGKIKIK